MTPLPFPLLFSKIGYFCIVVAVVANVIAYGVEELQRNLKHRNQLLEQTVEKGTITLQQQEEELRRAGEIQQMLLPNTLPQESLRGGGAVLGALPDWIYQDHAAKMHPGDKLLLFTDGITEVENAQLEEFGEERLLEVARARDGSALEIQRAIMQRVTTFCSGNFRDDATLLVLRIS